MTTITASTLINTGYVVEADDTGTLVIKTGVTPTEAMSISDAQVVTFVNPPVGVDAFASGTTLVFAQTAAPTGWTKSTTHNNKALRIVSGTAGSGGTVAFTTAFASKPVAGTIDNTTAGGSISVSGSVGSTTLGTNEIPSHNHIQGLGNDGGVTGRYGNATGLSSVRIDYDGAANNGTQAVYVSSTGGGGSHNHSFSGSGSFTGTAHNHTFTGTAIDLAVQYVDVILAVKD